MESALKKAGAYEDAKWPAFARALHYRQTDLEDQESFKTLAQSLRNLDKQFQTVGNRIFYIALPPTVYKPAARMIGRAGAGRPRPSAGRPHVDAFQAIGIIRKKC